MSELVPHEPTLDALAVEIREETAAADQDWRSALGHAIRAGELLLEAKERVGHGHWLPWLEANFPDSDRTARLYMRLAANRHVVAKMGSIREALAVLNPPKDVEPSDEEPDAPERLQIPAEFPRSANHRSGLQLVVNEPENPPPTTRPVEYQVSSREPGKEPKTRTISSEWHHGKRGIDPNRVLSTLELELDALLAGIELMDTVKLDDAVLADGIASLRRSRKVLGDLVRALSAERERRTGDTCSGRRH